MEIVADGSVPSFAQLAKNERPIFNVALARESSYANVDIAVKRRPDRSRWRCGVASAGREELLHRSLQPAGEQLPRLQS